MSKRPHIPTYRHHKQSGQAIVTLPDGQGGRRDILLGRYGTEASLGLYHRVIAEWQASGGRPPRRTLGQNEPSVNEIILAYWQHVESYYRHPDGRPTSEVNNIKQALRRLKELYGLSEAARFDAVGLEAVRARMIADGLCRNRVNKDVSRIKRMFKWAVARRLLPLAVHQSLSTAEGLRAGRSEARETGPVKPVPVAFVEKTIPRLLRPVAAMVQLQLLPGMRPGEVVSMRGLDLDMSGKIWLYCPGSDRGPHGQHKNAHRGHQRIIPMGPRGQEIIRQFLKAEVPAYLFSPADAVAEMHAARRAGRKSKLYIAQVYHRKRKPKCKPGVRYTVRA
jgi:integrase